MGRPICPILQCDLSGAYNGEVEQGVWIHELLTMYEFGIPSSFLMAILTLLCMLDALIAAV
jgi:hypothetical protein